MRQNWPERIYLVRHGQSQGNVARDAAHEAGLLEIDIDVRDVDVPLSRLGVEQAEAAGRWFAGLPERERPEIILSSPYVRAKQTAEIICRTGALAGGPAHSIVDGWKNEPLPLARHCESETIGTVTLRSCAEMLPPEEVVPHPLTIEASPPCQSEVMPGSMTRIGWVFELSASGALRRTTAMSLSLVKGSQPECTATFPLGTPFTSVPLAR